VAVQCVEPDERLFIRLAVHEGQKGHNILMLLCTDPHGQAAISLVHVFFT
jgi:hypothetical protein